jgi:hypothetical protein
LRGRDDGGNVTKVQYKSNWNCHYESPPYNKLYPNKIYKKMLKNILWEGEK